MLWRRKEMLLVSLFVLFVLVDVWLRFFFLERGHWTCNQGVFWGITVPPGLFWLGAAMLLGWCIWFFVAQPEGFRRGMIALVFIGGAINLLDRLLFGCVLDYLSWPWVFGEWLPHFNFADGLILLGFSNLLFFWTSSHEYDRLLSPSDGRIGDIDER